MERGKLVGMALDGASREVAVRGFSLADQSDRQVVPFVRFSRCGLSRPLLKLFYWRIMLKKIISGGQTGADQSGLIAASRFGIQTGGWMPNGFETKEGPNPELAERFGLFEHRGGYADRTSTNVRLSDGTIRLAGTFNSIGEKCTLKYIKKHRKPHFDVDMHDPRPEVDVVEWILSNNIEVLNVAGNSKPASISAKAFGIEDFAVGYLVRVLGLLGHAAL